MCIIREQLIQDVSSLLTEITMLSLMVSIKKAPLDLPSPQHWHIEISQFSQLNLDWHLHHEVVLFVDTMPSQYQLWYFQTVNGERKNPGNDMSRDLLLLSIINFPLNHWFRTHRTEFSNQTTEASKACFPPLLLLGSVHHSGLPSRMLSQK